MLPQKQVFIGISALITGVILQAIIGLRFGGIRESAIEVVHSGGQLSPEHMDSLLEQTHMQMLWMSAGIILSLLLIVAGISVAIWGIVRHFKRKEQTNDLSLPTTNA